jgi:hypothetical protein
MWMLRFGISELQTDSDNVDLFETPYITLATNSLQQAVVLVTMLLTVKTTGLIERLDQLYVLSGVGVTPQVLKPEEKLSPNQKSPHPLSTNEEAGMLDENEQSQETAFCACVRVRTVSRLNIGLGTNAEDL